METPTSPTPLPDRLREGLARIAAVMRSDDWRRAQEIGVNPTQLAVLQCLEGRRDGMRVGDIASVLGVSQPTATDSIATLAAKQLVEKRIDSGDGRSVRVFLTPTGQAATQGLSATPGAAEAVLQALPGDDQEQMLDLLVDLIRRLQERGAIPIQRMCVSCRHFRPYAHADAARPHHCAFVDAAFGQQDLRIECRDHEAADPATRTAIWAAFDRDRPPILQAP